MISYNQKPTFTSLEYARSWLSTMSAEFWSTTCETSSTHLLPLRDDPFRGCWCDSCGRVLYETRLICLACVDKGFTNTTDVCRACMGVFCSRGQLKHDPSHSMIKFEYAVHNFKEVWSSRDIAKQAKIELKAAQQAEGPSDSVSSLLCICCSKTVSIPCWVCQLCGKCCRLSLVPAS